jgi:mRNA (guanine-N7-)-methyltransferase
MASLSSKRPREDENHAQGARPRKRPGGAARISKHDADVVLQRQEQRAEAERQAAQTRGVEEVVRQHYNAVPQFGREYRKTDSRIKGLRSFNNWIKSTIIHKFSPSESREGRLRVLDIGCGKGGDLGKWQKAPQPVELYVGVDPAEISIDQAKERYTEMRSGGGRGGRGDRGGRGGYQGGRPQQTFHAEFFAEDAFTYSLGDLPIIREVGFGPGSRFGPTGGFDVVSMMFCMHYAFETEAKAKGMLANVAGSLKKGGRFLGVIPNSDILRSGVEAFHRRKSRPQAVPHGSADDQTTSGDKPTGIELSESPPYVVGSPSPEHDASDPVTSELPTICVNTDNDKHSNDSQTAAVNVLTEPPLEGPPSEANGVRSACTTNGTSLKDHSSQAVPHGASPPLGEVSNAQEAPASEAPVAEWGNSIYRVRFPGDTPKDGVFRPPYGWKYSFFMEEAVEEVPEYVVPWEAFRGHVHLFFALVNAVRYYVNGNTNRNSSY